MFPFYRHPALDAGPRHVYPSILKDKWDMYINYWVYILANKQNGTLYIGVTSDLPKRIWEHKQGLSSFVKRYGVLKLVYYERHENIEPAIKREKLIKRWKRQWKLSLIEKNNPGWEDLFFCIV